MFLSTQIDKVKSNTQNYERTDIFNHKPSYSLLIFFIYTLFYSGIAKSECNQAEELEFSDNVKHLYNELLEQLAIIQTTPSESIKYKVSIPENKLFKRTKSVQLLFDYVTAATHELYADKYALNPNYHHIHCIDAFSPGFQYKITMNQMQKAVEQFINNNGDTLYSKYFEKYVKRSVITDQNHAGLPQIVGHYGIIAKQDVDSIQCIGHFYGDEYLLQEYEYVFDWDIYGEQNHPYRKKWDYDMIIKYNLLSDKRLKLSGLNVTVALDGYHLYYEEGRIRQNLEPFINDARKNLFKPRLTAADRERKNCEFVNCEIDGIIHTMVIIHDNVKKGQQLFVYYGDDFSPSVL